MHVRLKLSYSLCCSTIGLDKNLRLRKSKVCSIKVHPQMTGRRSWNKISACAVRLPLILHCYISDSIVHMVLFVNAESLAACGCSLESLITIVPRTRVWSDIDGIDVCIQMELVRAADLTSDYGNT